MRRRHDTWRTRKIISDWTRSLICLLSESFERFCLMTRAAVSLIASVFDLIFCAWVTNVGTAVYVIEMCLTTGASPKRVDAPSPFISLRSRGVCA